MEKCSEVHAVLNARCDNTSLCVEVVVNGDVKCDLAVLDTGSSLCVAPWAVCESCEVSPTAVKLLDVQGKGIDVLGQTELNLSINGLTVKQNFVVARVGVLLVGCDFFTKYNCRLNFDRMEMTIGGHTARMLRNRRGNLAAFTVETETPGEPVKVSDIHVEPQRAATVVTPQRVSLGRRGFQALYKSKCCASAVDNDPYDSVDHIADLFVSSKSADEDFGSVSQTVDCSASNSDDSLTLENVNVCDDVHVYEPLCSRVRPSGPEGALLDATSGQCVGAIHVRDCQNVTCAVQAVEINADSEAQNCLYSVNLCEFLADEGSADCSSAFDVRNVLAVKPCGQLCVSDCLPADCMPSREQPSVERSVRSTRVADPDMTEADAYIELCCLDRMNDCSVAFVGEDLSPRPAAIVNSERVNLCAAIKTKRVSFAEDSLGASPTLYSAANHVPANIPADRVPALLDLFERSVAELNNTQREQVWDVITSFQDVFSVDPDDLGHTTLIQHQIDVGDAKPIRVPPRRLPIAKQAFVQDEIQKLLKRGVIRESVSPWSSPVVLVEHASKPPRLCIDYRLINQRVKFMATPLPRIDDLFDRLSGSSWFCSLDVRSMFWQIGLSPESVPITAFAVGHNLYEWLVTPFGLSTSPSVTCRLMEMIFRGMKPEEVLYFIDDLIAHACSFDQVLCHLREVLTRLRRASLKLNIQKCKLFRRVISVLGHTVSEAGLETQQSKIDAVSSWPRPTTVKQLRSFLGLCSYYRRFVKSFSSIAKVLFDLTHKRVRYVWDERHELAFNELKRMLTSAPILTLPSPDAVFLVDCDASDHGLGCVLSVVTDKGEQVVEYFSRVLSKTERNYCVTRRELLAVVKALAHFHVYLCGRPFTVRVDHASLKWLMNFRQLEGQMARWVERIMMYKFEIVHRAGKSHGNADALSRRPCLDEGCKFCQRVDDSEVPDKVDQGLKGKELEEVGLESGVESGEARLAAQEVGTDSDSGVGAELEKGAEEEDLNILEKTSSAAVEVTGDHPGVVKLVTERSLNGLDGREDEELGKGGNQVDEDHFETAGAREVGPSVACSTTLGPSRNGFSRKSVFGKDGDHGANIGCCGSVPVQLIRVDGIDLKKAQEEDEILGDILRTKRAGGERPTWGMISDRSPSYKEWWAEWELLIVKDDVLYRRWYNDGNKDVSLLPAIPRSMRDECISSVHDGVGGAHFGRARTLKRVVDLFYWPRRRQTVIAYCRNCIACVTRKGPLSRAHGPMQDYRVGAPMERVGVDILGPLPVTDSGNRYVLVAMDYFSKWPYVAALPNQEAATVADSLVRGFFCQFGSPLELHSDRGTNFESAVMSEVCKLFGIKKTRTTSLYPQGDGLVERWNRTLVNSLSLYVAENHRDWDRYLEFICLAYRSVQHEATAEAPCRIMLGRSIRGPAELNFPTPPGEPATTETQYVLNLQQKLSEVHDFVRNRLKLSNAKTRDRYDRISVRDQFIPGDAVWLYQPRVLRGRSPKFKKPWTGPFKVIQRLSDVVYRIQLSPRSKPMTVNRYRLWKCTVQLPDDWFSAARADSRVAAAASDPVSEAAAAAAAVTDEDRRDVTEPYAHRADTGSDSEWEENYESAALRETADRDVNDTGQPQQLKTRSGRSIKKPLRFV